MKEENMHYGST